MSLFPARPLVRMQIAPVITICFLLIAPPLARGCTASALSPSVTICTPTSGSSEPAPVHVTALATDTAHPVTAMKVYLDGGAVYAISSNSVDTFITPTSNGTHNLTINAWDSSGAVFKASETFMVTAGTSGSVVLSPSSLTFATQLLGTASAAQTATLHNGTASVIAITGVTATGDFLVGSNNCGSGLAAGTSCTVAVSFQPTAAGTRVGTLTISDSAGSQAVPLTGSGIADSGSCVAGPIAPSVTICSPAASTTNATPVHLVAASNSSFPITAMRVKVDSNTVYTATSAAIDLYVGMTGGAHVLAVQATDSTGQTFQSSVSITADAPAQNWPPCALNNASQTVTICNPPPDGILSLPVHLAAGATDTSNVSQMSLSIDGASPTYTVVNASTLDVYISSLTPGPHVLAVQATNSSGVQYSNKVPVVVSDNDGLSKLQHVIVYVQENRSFDNYFGLLGPYRAARGYTEPTDGLDLNTVLFNAAGEPVQPYHYRTVCTEDLGEKWDPTRLAINNGLMDLFLKETARYEPSTIDPNGNRSIGYYDSVDIPYYYELATQFPTSDRYFSSVTAPTAPNRMYLFAGTSFGYMYQLDGPAGGWTQTTIFDRLDATGVSWKYYLQDTTNFLAQWSTYARDAQKVFPISQYYTDIANNTLPQVAFIEHAHNLGWDEHPLANIQYGAKATAKIINALMASPSWPTSAFILTYDEAGGIYDHVLPATMIKPDKIKPKLTSTNQPGDFGRTGTRVPIVVVSPWARAHLMSHVWREHTSILRLIEDRFGVPPLTARDAVADNMTEMFDFSAPAFAAPPPLPVQPTNGVCNKSLETN